MLNFHFKDYEGFKEIFGIRECGDGTKSRCNKILLSYIKQHSLIKAAFAGDDGAYARLNTRNMTNLKKRLIQDLFDAGTCLDISKRNTIRLIDSDWIMFSEKYKLDHLNGLCEDRDYKKIRYINCESGRVYKMKAGKFLNTVMLETEWGRSLPEPVRLWFCEEFTQAWETYARAMMPEYELHIDYDFEKIYDSNYCPGDFHSCMVDEGYDSFYNDYVKARAAYLTSTETGDIIARCVIFDEVHLADEDRVLRLAERQYSTEGQDVLKRLLVDALIKAGEIDGYKSVGAGCHDSHAFVLNDGSALRDDMWIKCTADDGDICSYQDSFKYLNTRERKAYNDEDYDHDANLDTTSGYVETLNYDDWHDCYTENDLVRVYYHGEEYLCDECRLNEFVEVDGTYYHTDDVAECEYCGEYFVDGEGYESDVTGKVYCCMSCMEEDERQYKKDHWYYSEYDDEYYEDEDDVVSYVNDFGRTETISRDSLEWLIDNGKVVELDGVYQVVVTE